MSIPRVTPCRIVTASGKVSARKSGFPQRAHSVHGLCTVGLWKLAGVVVVLGLDGVQEGLEQLAAGLSAASDYTDSGGIASAPSRFRRSGAASVESSSWLAWPWRICEITHIGTLPAPGLGSLDAAGDCRMIV